jgi:hypothetical protein
MGKIEKRSLIKQKSLRHAGEYLDVEKRFSQSLRKGNSKIFYRQETDT